MAVREAASNQGFNVGLLPIENALGAPLPATTAKDESPQNAGAQFLNQDALAANRSDLSANIASAQIERRPRRQTAARRVSFRRRRSLHQQRFGRQRPASQVYDRRTRRL